MYLKSYTVKFVLCSIKTKGVGGGKVGGGKFDTKFKGGKMEGYWGKGEA